ncbi:MAG: N-methyl-L-tryptophan oxidase [Rubrobacteraceae bacterium]
MQSFYDVIVIGLGGMGSSASYQLARRGKKVLGLERYNPPHEWGSSHGRSRIIRQAYFEDPAYVPLLLRAYELWEQLERDSGRDILTITGGLMMGHPESDLVEGSRESAGRHDLPHEILEAPEIKRRFPVFEPTPETVALYEPRAGLVRPETSIAAHLEHAARRGADLRFGEPVRSWDAGPGGEGVVVKTGSGTYEAERLVISAGSWAPEILSEMGLPLEVTRQLLFWFEPDDVELFRPEGFPVYIWEPEDGNTFYGIPAHDGERGVKAAFFRADAVPCTPETIAREVEDDEVDFVRGYMARYLPRLDGRLLQAQTCMYTNTPDLHFVISPNPQLEQVIVAAGFSGHGYKMASVVGEILADLATDGETRHPIDLFSPDRSFPPTTKD